MTAIDILKKALGLDVQFDHPGFDKDSPPSVAQAILVAGLAICEQIEDVGNDLNRRLEDTKGELHDLERELSNLVNFTEQLVKAWRES